MALARSGRKHHRKNTRKEKCEAADAVGALDPGVPYESRWAPYVRIHGPGQGQFPKGSIRPRGYMAPDARRSLANTNVATKPINRQRRSHPPLEGGGTHKRSEVRDGVGLSIARIITPPRSLISFAIDRPPPGEGKVEGSASCSIVKQPKGQPSAFPRRRRARAVRGRCPSREQEGAGNAGCQAAPAALCAKSGSTQAWSHHRYAETFRHSLRDGFTVSFALFPGTGLCCPRRRRDAKHRRRLGASVGAPEPHDFAVRKKRRSSCDATRVHRIPRSTIVTTRPPLLMSTGQREEAADLRSM